MSTVQAKFEATETAFHVKGYEKIEFSLWTVLCFHLCLSKRCKLMQVVL